VRQRPLRRTLLTSLVLPAAVLLPAGSSRAAPLQDFSASAASSGVRMLYKNALDNTGTQIDVSGPVTTARVTSDPDSSAFASAPYPGDDLISLANTLGPAAGVPPQPYPASVSSNVPGRPHQETSAPAGYSLSATSTATRSTSSATAGPGTAGDATVATAGATSEVQETAAGVSAKATSSTDSFTAGPLVLSRVRSTASAVLDASGKTTLKSSIELGDATISGQKVGLTRDGLTVAGTGIPLPAGQLTDALAAAGVTVTYLAETRTDTSVTAPGLVIHYKDDTQDTTYTLGRAQAGVVATPDVSSVPTLPVVDIGSSGDVATGSPTTGGIAPVQPGSVPGTEGTGPAPDVTAGQPPTTTTQPVTRAATRTPQTFHSGVFYLVLVVSAAAAMVVAQLMRYLGVRWASS
jgi:hypothetical protein